MMMRPRPLRHGDTIAIISPATTVREEYIDGAARLLEGAGYRVRVMPHAKGPAYGTFAATAADRLADFTEAYLDPQVRAILCARGGYGCVHLIDSIPPQMLAADPKWVIGFSDVSALHAMMLHAGAMSLHAPMAKHLTTLGADNAYTRALLNALTTSEDITYTCAAHPLNRQGTASGQLRGGNLAVLNGLADTPYDILHVSSGTPTVLFIEDIAEKVYAVERMLTRLALSGSLQRAAGLIVGAFTEYTPDKNHSSMEEMIDRLLTRRGIDIPVSFGFPVGHTDINAALVEGAQCRLDVGSAEVKLTIYA